MDTRALAALAAVPPDPELLLPLPVDLLPVPREELPLEVFVVPPLADAVLGASGVADAGAADTFPCSGNSPE